MKASERLYRTIQKKDTDRVPCICPGGMMNMMTTQLMEISDVFWPEAHINPEAMAELACTAYTNGLFDNIGVPFCMTVEAEAMGAEVNLGDRYTEPRVSAYPLVSVENWEALSGIHLTKGRPLTVLKALRLIRKQHPDAAIIGNLTGPISLASSLIEANAYYKGLRKKSEESHKFMDFVTSELIAFGKAQIEAGADFITISDPSGTGEILGPKLFKEYALPCLNRICRELKPLCKGVIIHICGQLQTIYSSLADMECDVISVDAVVNITAMKEQVAGKLVMGNVSTFALANGTDDIIQKLCRNCLKNGVDILAPACGLGTTTTLEHIRLLRKAVETNEQNSFSSDR